MRCSRIEFEGYRRLASASTNIDGDITAFVGFNEAGKTTLLSGLAWFSAGGALRVTDKNRTRPPQGDTSEVVRIFFELSEEDKQAIIDIPCEMSPTSFSLARKVNDERSYTLRPWPQRPRMPFTLALARLETAMASLPIKPDTDLELKDDEEDDGPFEWASTLASALKDPDRGWDSADFTALAKLRDWLLVVPDRRKTPRDAKLVALLEAAGNLARRVHPTDEIWEVLRLRMPQFVLFKDEHRTIESTYELTPPQRAIPPAVNSLLHIAGVDLDVLWTHIQNGDSTNRATLLERGNERLQNLFSQAWNQSGITVRLNVDGTLLEIMVRELYEGGDVTNIGERSDGLRTFVALVAFLAAGEFSIPPILLIDEAETHLHYDAQADLVGVLLKNINATQVFYTTHSPGCLPSDLGTGIRVVVRDPEHANASVIRNNFWEGEGPGFSPLLFAMGASAAAFSMCRQAVLAEGASDMVLLPTLIRKATGLSDLDYQIAQGLANAHGSGIRVEEVAAKVVYLIDGDQGGADHVDLLVAAGVDRKRTCSLPEGHAVEDLIEPTAYLKVVNGFLDVMGQKQRFGVDDLVQGEPIAKTFQDWAKKNRVRTPSKVEVAYALLRHDSLRLTAKGKQSLVSLHHKFTKAFEAKPST